MRLVLLADVHSNTLALDAVLTDLKRWNADGVVNLGDSVWGSLDPAGAAQRLMGLPSVRGNQDEIVDLDHPDLRGLTPEKQRWLNGLPLTLTGGDVLCCHGTPTSNTTYLLETVTPQGARSASSAEIRQRLAGLDVPVITCGHSHLPRTFQLPGGPLLINPGSVGMPAYDHDVPFLHVMEAGSPHARYAVLTQQAAGWKVEHVAVPYDWEGAAQRVAGVGRPDRAAWLQSGLVQKV